MESLKNILSLCIFVATFFVSGIVYAKEPVAIISGGGQTAFCPDDAMGCLDNWSVAAQKTDGLEAKGTIISSVLNTAVDCAILDEDNKTVLMSGIVKPNAIHTIGGNRLYFLAVDDHPEFGDMMSAAISYPPEDLNCQEFLDLFAGGDMQVLLQAYIDNNFIAPIENGSLTIINIKK